MSRISKLFLALSAFFVLALTTPTVKADTIVIGQSTNENRFPFGVDLESSRNYEAGATYQQLYNGAAFGPSPVSITQIAFASGSGIASPGTVTENLMLSLATAATPLGSPSSTFAANRGPDFTTVFNGTVTATMTRTDTFDLVFNLTTPFTYNPASGPLLLDVMLNAAPVFTGERLYFRAGDSADVSRVFNIVPSLDGFARSGDGLWTQFSVKPIPEPATVLLLSTGLAGIAGVARRRRKAQKAEKS